MRNIFLKVIFYFFRPKIILVAGKNKKTTAKTISKTLGRYFKLGLKLFVFEIGLENPQAQKKLEFLINVSSSSVLVLTAFEKGDGEKIKELAKIFAGRGKIVLDCEDENVKKLQEDIEFQGFAFGFGDEADFRASDIKSNGEINFKLNHKGSSVPVWIKESGEKGGIGPALAAAAAGAALGLNLIEISQALKD